MVYIKEKTEIKSSEPLEILSPQDIILYQRIKGYYPGVGYFTLNIPFVCQNCGRCCSQIGFPIGEAILPKIGNHLNITPEDVEERYLKTGDEDNGRVLAPCPFLKYNMCSIYPVRPEGCKFFPLALDFKDYGIGCEGLKRLRELEEKLIEGCSEIISRSKSVEMDRAHQIAVKVPKTIINDFLKLKISQTERELFFILNSSSVTGKKVRSKS
ncbi:MAG: YkgJ family cysteine cluster protein [Archaeoglobaceae archaeon]